MKFVFPQNYDFKSKLLGFIEYTTLFFNALWAILIFLITSFFKNITFKISLFIILFFPVLLFSIIGFNNEKITYIIKYMLIYIRKPKCYIYRKSKYWNLIKIFLKVYCKKYHIMI